MSDGHYEATSPAEILARVLNSNEAKTETEWVCADEITRLKAEVERLREVLKLFECDCEGEEYCYRREKCRNYIARAAHNPSQEPRT